MPELPEVESVLRYLTEGFPSLIGRQVREIKILRDSVVDGNSSEFVQTLTSLTCLKILRHGKYLFFGFQESRATHCRWMALHLRMTGRLFLVPTDQAFVRHTRLSLLLDHDVALRFDDPRAFGRVWIITDPSEVINKLGDDALLIDFTVFAGNLRNLHRQLKPLLLDQSFVAGIGNIYADEILFRARLHPLQVSSELMPEDISRLYDALHGVLNQAVALKGANIDGVFEAGSFPVAVYGRNRKPCPVCSALIVKERLGQRGTHYCPVCQPLVKKDVRSA
jgi:formamidopyrimidine-DNA glycosylase